MTDSTRTLHLTAGLDDVTGCGDELVFHVHGYRKNKAGNYERYKLELKTCRYAATRLLRELREMHVRDLKRLEQETALIESERGILTKEPPG